MATADPALPGLQQAVDSIFFTSKVAETDLTRLLTEQGDAVQTLAHTLHDQGFDRIFLVGCGSSFSSLYSGEYLLSRFTTLPAKVLTGYEFVGRGSPAVDERALVILTSYAGETEDTVAAMRFANEHGATTVTFINRPECTMGREAGHVFPYQSIALYLAPLLQTYLFSLEWAHLDGSAEAAEALTQVERLPTILGGVYRDAEAVAAAHAYRLQDAKLLYVLSAGSLWGLGFKFALSVFMENIRIHGSFIPTSEFRHGPVEMLDRNSAPMVFLLADDEQREIGERVLSLVQSQGVDTVVFDAAQHPELPALFAPFALLIYLEWFTVYSCVLRGITDLDERVYMGKGILSKPGISWP